MNIIIVGAGEVGQHLAGMLSREEHAVTIVDPDPTKSRKLSESFDLQAVVGDGTRADTLTEVGTASADLVVAVTDSDHANLLTSVVAKRLGAKRVIVRLKDTRILEGYAYFYKDALGFDVAISVEQLAAEKVMEMVRDQHALEVESFANGKVQLRRLRLREESELTSAPLGEVRIPADSLVAAVSRKGAMIVPSGDHDLRVGDQIYVIGTPRSLDAFERTCGERVEWKRRVVVFGATTLGRAIAMGLSHAPGIDVLVIEKDRARAQALDLESSGNVTVLVGDAMDRNVLQEEGIGDANVFVATTADDDRNIVACQLAKSFGVERTVALIEESMIAEIFGFLEGVDQAFSPRIASASAILRFVRAGSPLAIALIGGGKAEVLEFRASVTEPIRVKKLGLPKGVRLGAIVNDSSVTIPRGDSMIRPGDTLIVFAVGDAVEEVQRLLHARG